MSPDDLSVQKQRLSFPYNYFAVKKAGCANLF